MYEVLYNKPMQQGTRTPLHTRQTMDRKKVERHIDGYVKKGYHRGFFISEEVYLSTFLPTEKPANINSDPGGKNTLAK